VRIMIGQILSFGIVLIFYSRHRREGRRAVVL